MPESLVLRKWGIEPDADRWFFLVRSAPNVAPGVAAGIGSIAIVVDASGVDRDRYSKTGLGVTDWAVVGGGAGGPHTHDAADLTTGTLDSARLPAGTTAARGAARVDHNSAGDPQALTAAGHALDADPHSQYALDAEKGQASGLATLDGSAKLTASQLPLGSSAQTACAGNDARLIDARTPTAHTLSHEEGGSDELDVAQLGGFPGGTSDFLRADGSFAAPPGGSGAATTAAAGVVKVDNNSAGDPVALTAAGHGLDADPHTQYALQTEFDDHSARHQSGGADAIKLDDFAAPDDNTDLNASASAHGLLPKLSGDAGDVLKGDGTWGAGGAGGDDPRLITKELTADQGISSTTMAKVTGLDQTLQPGTYWFEYRVIWQTTVTGTAIKLGVNFSGTQTRFVVEATGAEATTAASTGAMDQVHAAFGLRSGGANRAPSTTVSIFGPTAADTADADMMAIIKGVIRVTVAGDLQLYFGSEATGSTQTCESGSALRVTQVSA